MNLKEIVKKVFNNGEKEKEKTEDVLEINVVDDISVKESLAG